MSTVKVGSLFDGIGGTPLSAVRAGAEPVWASEIEKWPISITKRHFPNMKHLGDITQINGSEIEPVDIIVGGSPCQDLSVAGKRAGLDGERSGLFMDQCRIIKEMRNATRQTTTRQTDNGSADLPRPRYMVWENVPGAFSSNRGEDFRAVLEEIARIADDKASIPGPPKGKWLRSGTILGDGYSISWRTVDAQYWGVPQRRRRIYLVADFGGESAPEILFERESVSGDITEGGEARKGAAGDAEGGTGEAGVVGVDCYNHVITGDISATLTAQSGSSATHSGPQIMTCLKTHLQGEASGVVSKGNGEAFLMREKHMALTCGGGQAGQGYPCVLVGGSSAAVCYGISSYHSNSMKSSNPHSGVYIAKTSRTIDQNGGNPACNQGGIAVVEPVCYSLQGNMIGRADKNGPQGSGVNEDVSFTLNTTDRHAVCYNGENITSPTNAQNPKIGDPCHTLGTDSRNYVLIDTPTICFDPRSQDGVHRIHGDVVPTLNTAQGGQRQPCVCYSLDRACFNQGVNAKYDMSIQPNTSQTLVARGPHAVAEPPQYIVRRLTPLECERLQGYPDGWTQFDEDGKEISDTQRYKALGNSFAVPNAYFFISRCVQVLNEQDPNGRR